MPASLPISAEIRPIVYTKATWAGDWIETPLMQALSLSVAAAPSHSQATLQWKYGVTIQPKIGSRAADRVLTPIPRGDFLGNYVRVEFGDQVWWGVIQDVQDSRNGVLEERYPTGVQTYTAFGLTWFLDQAKPILQSKVKYSGGTWIIDRSIPFNGGTDGTRKKAVAWKNYDPTAKCFTDRTQTASPQPWTAAAAVGYLLDNFSPRDAAGDELVPFVLADDADSFLNYELPLTDYDGLTPWEAIVRLVDRRRGLLLTTTVVDDEIHMIVRSQNATEITLPSGAVIPANPDTRTYNFDNAVNVRNPSISTTLLSRFDQVIVLGERAGSVFTIRPQSNAEPEWVLARATEYRQGASLLPGYSSLSDADKSAANEDRRAADDLAKVYSWWRIRSTWDGRSDTDPTSGSAPYALPKIDSDGTVDLATRANVQRGGLRIADYLPLRQGLNYHTADPITPTVNDADSADGDFLAPILLLKTTAIRASGDAGWVHAERLNAASASESSKRPNNFSVDLKVREDALGLIFETQGAPQHYLAKDDFSPLSSFEAIPSGEGINLNDWLATVYVQQDQYCRAQYPKQADLPSLDLIRPLVLRIANAFLDYVVPGTILAVQGGELKKTAAGGYVRDDRPRLNDVARMAYEWHCRERRTLNLSLRGIVSGFSVGHLITSIGSGSTLEEINTAITSVSYDFTAGTMQVQTQFGELDFTV